MTQGQLACSPLTPRMNDRPWPTNLHMKVSDPPVPSLLSKEGAHSRTREPTPCSRIRLMTRWAD